MGGWELGPLQGPPARSALSEPQLPRVSLVLPDRPFTAPSPGPGFCPFPCLECTLPQDCPFLAASHYLGLDLNAHRLPGCSLTITFHQDSSPAHDLIWLSYNVCNCWHFLSTCLFAHLMSVYPSEVPGGQRPHLTSCPVCIPITSL